MPADLAQSTDELIHVALSDEAGGPLLPSATDQINLTAPRWSCAVLSHADLRGKVLVRDRSGRN